MTDRSQRNKQLAQKWMDENWNKRNAGIIDELMHPSCRGRMEGGEMAGRDEFVAARSALLQAFPDFRMDVKDTVAEGDLVALRWEVTGTHRGDFAGMRATGRPVHIVGTTWMWFDADGRMTSGCDTWNLGALVASLQAP